MAHSRPDLLLAARPLVDAVAAGAGGILIIDGAPGTGRTTSIDQVADLARRGGLRTVTVRAVPSSAEVPFGIVRALGEDLGAKFDWAGTTGAGDVAEVSRSLLDAGDPDEDRPGTCLLVDDAQWADDASLRALVQMARRLRDHAVALVVATGPDGTVAPSAARLDELRSSSGALLHRLGPLDPEDAGALVERALGADTEPSVRDHLLHRTGANPFLLTAVLEHLVASDDDPSAPVVPERVRAAVATRLAWIGPEAVALAEAVHVLGDDTTVARAATLAGLDRRAAEDAADALARSGILVAGLRLAFREPLVGDAVGRGLDAFASQRWHRAAADLLVADGEPPDRIATHLMRTVPAGHDWVVAQLRLAAARAVEVGDCAEAADLLRRAWAEPPSAEVRPAVLSELAFAESRAGDPGAAPRIEEALASVRSPGDRLMLLRERTRLMWLTGRLPEAVEACEAALQETDPGTPVHDQLLAELLAVASMHDVSPIFARPQLVALLDRAGSGWIPDSPALAATLATVLPFVLGDLRLVGPLVDRALEEDLWRGEAPPFGMRPDFVIGSLWLSDGLERGIRIAHEGLEVVDEGNLFRHGLLHYWLGELHYAAGDLPGTLESATAAVAPGWGPIVSWIGFSTATLAHAHLDLDDPRRAEELLDGLAGQLDPDQLYGIAVDLARARVLLHTDRPQAAAELAEQVGVRLVVLGHQDSPQITWRPLAAAASAAVGDVARARSLADEEVELAERSHAAGRLGRALRTRAAVGAPAERLALLQRAAAVLAPTERRLEHARTLLALGVELHGAGDTIGARTVLADARQMAETCGADPVANRALVALHATGARPRRSAQRGLDSLTGAERSAVELAAAGKTNREIGDVLGVAPRTVEWHLGRAYTKLGVGSRRDLPAALERRT